LDVAQDLKALSAILEAKNFTFTIDLAALASRREYLNLEKWLQERITEHGLPFIKAALSFLKERTLANRAQQEQGLANNNSSPQLSPETLNIFFTTLWSKLKYAFLTLRFHVISYRWFALVHCHLILRMT